MSGVRDAQSVQEAGQLGERCQLAATPGATGKVSLDVLTIRRLEGSDEERSY